LNSDPQNDRHREGAEENSDENGGQSRDEIQSAEGCREESPRQIQSRQKAGCSCARREARHRTEGRDESA
jgi:hypothetical protein